MMKTKIAFTAAALSLMLTGCGGLEDGGAQVTDKRHSAGYWQSQCVYNGKTCTMTGYWVPDSWNVKLQAWEDDAWYSVSEYSYHHFAEGDAVCIRDGDLYKGEC